MTIHDDLNVMLDISAWGDTPFVVSDALSRLLGIEPIEASARMLGIMIRSGIAAKESNGEIYDFAQAEIDELLVDEGFAFRDENGFLVT